MHATFRGTAVGLILLGACAGESGPLVDPQVVLGEIDPRIGSGGVGFGVGSIPPGPLVPFGLARPAPDTSTNGGAQPGFSHCAGYYWEDDEIRAFSQLHLSGTGVPDYGALGVMPVGRRLEGRLSDADYRARFDHRDERVRVGRYEVALSPSGIQVRVGATAHVAVYRFEYPAHAALVLDLAHGIGNGRTVDAVARFDPVTGRLGGWVQHVGGLSGGIGGWRVYFAGRLDRVPEEVRGLGAARTLSSVTTSTGAGAGLVLDFGQGGSVGLELAVSFVDEAAAQASLEAESVGFDLDLAETRARELWARVVERVEVEGGTEVERRIFYSALYRTHHMPTSLTEADGRYVGIDDRVHTARGFTYHSDLSLWDTFRTLHPLMQLVYPERQRDFVSSLSAMQEAGGGHVIGRWPLASGETWTMIGSHGETVVAESLLRGGVDGFDFGAWFERLHPAVLAPMPFLGEPRANRECLDQWTTQNYCAQDRGGTSVSRTLENAFNDALLARGAEKLGRTVEAAALRTRAEGWKKLWDPESRWLRGRPASGEFAPGFDPGLFSEDFTEGNARQWLFFVPQDLDGLATLFGGREALVERLDGIFSGAAMTEKTPLPDPWYWHGNEPDIHGAYTFTALGRPDLTRRWVRWIMTERYADTPAGLDGNDDGGTLSAWYVLSAIGVYPALATEGYVLNPPLFSRVRLQRGPGHTLEIRREGEGERMTIEVDGRVLDGTWISHDALVAAKTLVFKLE